MTSNWHIDLLRLHNFRHYEDLTIEFGREVTLLIGKNGAGKTSVLDALAVLLAPVNTRFGGDGRNLEHWDARLVPRDLDSITSTGTLERMYPVSVHARAKFAGSPFEWNREIRGRKGRTTWGNREVRDFSNDLMNRAQATGGTEIVLPVLAYYGVERLVGERRAQGSIPPSRSGAYFSSLDPRSDLKRLFGLLESLDESIVRAQAFGDKEPRAARRQFDAIEFACNSILQTVGWQRLRWNSTISEVTLQHDDHGTLPLTKLATGTRIAAGLAIDLASRMARANPGLGGDELLRSVPGIVLIDEVDLHLHPSWQQQIVPALRRTFPRIQFILTTHSPQVISTIEAENIRILHGSVVSTPDFAQGLRSNVILQELQGVDPMPDVDVRKPLDEYLDLVSRGEGRSESAQRLRSEIDQKLGGSALNEELLSADAAMVFDDWEA